MDECVILGACDRRDDPSLWRKVPLVFKFCTMCSAHVFCTVLYSIVAVILYNCILGTDSAGLTFAAATPPAWRQRLPQLAGFDAAGVALPKADCRPATLVQSANALRPIVTQRTVGAFCSVSFFHYLGTQCAAPDDPDRRCNRTNVLSTLILLSVRTSANSTCAVQWQMKRVQAGKL